MLSIITINYNNRDGLRSTLRSIKDQQLQAIDLIVIDGGSDDGSQNVISEFSDLITFSVSEKDKGIYDAMNKGIRKAKGNFLLFLNSGDLFAYPDSLKNAYKYLLKKTVYNFRYFVLGFDSCWLSDIKYKTKCHQAIIFPNENFFFYSTNKGIHADAEYIEDNINCYGLVNVPLVLSKFFLGGRSNDYTLDNYYRNFNYLNTLNKITGFVKLTIVFFIGNKNFRLIVYRIKGFKKV